MLLGILLFIKIELIILIDQVLCFLNTDYVKLLSLVGHDLCLINTKLLNVKHSYLLDIMDATPDFLKSVHLNIGYNLLIDSWGNPIIVDPLNL
jgi:hypothetical protein